MAADIKGNAEAAKNKVAMRIGCHAIPRLQSDIPKVY